MIIVNGKELNVETFPNGEALIRNVGLRGAKHIIVTLSYEDDKDPIDLMLIDEDLQTIRERV